MKKKWKKSETNQKKMKKIKKSMKKVKKSKKKVDNYKRGESGNDSRFTKHDFKNLVKHH